MSTTTEKLTPQADEQRARLEEKLLTAQFDEDENGNRKYKNLGAHVLPLLQILGLHDWLYTIWRFSAPITINNETGPVYLIPIHVVSGTPQIEPGDRLVPGFKTYINDVKLQPELDCLFIVPRRKNN